MCWRESIVLQHMRDIKISDNVLTNITFHFDGVGGKDEMTELD